MQQKKGGLKILVAICILTAIAFLFLYLSSGSLFQSKEERQSEFMKLFSNAVKEKNHKFCDDVEEEFKDYCYIKMGKDLKNYPLCERDIADKEDRSLLNIRNQCYFWWAIKDQDLSRCDKIIKTGKSFYDNSENKWNCYSNIAKEKKDQEICKKIEEEEVKQRCYYLLSLESEDLSICEKVNKSNEMDISDCYLNLAINAGDPLICESVPNINKTNSCYVLVAEKLEDPDICKKIQGNQEDISWTKEEGCYSQVAKSMKDPSICDRINDPYLQNHCKINSY